MTRTEARLSKLEDRHVPAQRTHEEWLAILDAEPVSSTAGLGAEIEAEAIAEFGSLRAAAVAARAKANHTHDLMDDFLAS